MNVYEFPRKQDGQYIPDRFSPGMTPSVDDGSVADSEVNILNLN